MTELLAPAGSREALVAAVQNGADEPRRARHRYKSAASPLPPSIRRRTAPAPSVIFSSRVILSTYSPTVFAPLPRFYRLVKKAPVICRFIVLFYMINALS